MKTWETKRQTRFLPAFLCFTLIWFAAEGVSWAQAAGSVTPSPSFTPLTGPERWHRYWEETFLSPGLYFASLGAASGSQLGHDPPEWKQGAAGYGRRSLSLFGTFTIQTTIHEARGAALGYEPRYIRSKRPGALRRTAHALQWSLLTEDQHGQIRPDLPTLAGAYGSGMLTMYWYPQRYNPLTDGVRLGTQQLGFVAGVHLVQEFGPEIKRFFRIKR